MNEPRDSSLRADERSPRGRGLLVLTYHRVHGSRDAYNGGDVDLRTFDRQMSLLRRFFNVLRLDEAVGTLRADGQLPLRAVSITFDDGYRDNHETALPVLKRYALPATFFITTSILDDGIMWNDRVIEALRRTRQESLDLSDLGLGVFSLSNESERIKAVADLLPRLKYEQAADRDKLSGRIAELAKVSLPRDLMMSAGQVADLSRSGMEIGAHTHTHPIVRGLTPEALRAEIDRNRAILESITQQQARGFAYPNGRSGTDFTEREREVVAGAGFLYAMTTDWGCVRRRSDWHALPRIAPWDASPWKWCGRVLWSYFD